jgi:rod shape-determining protein MreD
MAMVRNQSPEHRAQRRPGSLSSLQPIDTTSFKPPFSRLYIWITILVIWLVSLLPWRLWPAAPDLLLLVLGFWCLNEPRRIGMPVAFFFGLLMDVHDSALLGGQALSYTLVAYGIELLRRRLVRFNAIVQAVHLLPVFLVAETVSRLFYAWLSGEWPGWGWLWSALFTVILWPLADFLLHLPQRRLDDADSGSH